jgi:8-amino-7-oxononanoate synthase
VAPIIDRRKIERWKPGHSVGITLQCGDDSISGEIRNFSQNGFSISTQIDLPIGSYVTALFESEKDKKIQIETRVIWKKKSVLDLSEVELGLFVMNRGDFDLFRQQVDNVNKHGLDDRRKTQRRKDLKDFSPKNKRSHERRNSNGIKKRILENSLALDKWGSNYTYERVIQSAASSTVRSKYKEKLMLGSNNYLGLTSHPKVKEAAIRAIEKYGAGAGGVRVLSGTMDLHRQLEDKIAKFKGAQSCLLFASGYIANYATLTALLEREDVVFNDELNHASIIDGCRASHSTLRFFKHSDIEGLRNKLEKYDYERSKLIITDGVFSMDGDVAKLKSIYELSKEHNAMLLVDDAHATGVIGASGRGTAEYCDVYGKIDLTMVTLSKALGSVGGAVCGSRETIKFITHHSRQFIFSSALPPSVCASVMASLEVIEREPALIENLHRNRNYLFNGLKNLGYNVRDTPTAVIPVIIGDEIKTYQLASALDDLNIFVNAVSRPAVPRELSRLRVSVMATHTLMQLDEAIESFRLAGKKIGLI